jgi:hypothetical protein
MLAPQMLYNLARIKWHPIDELFRAAIKFNKGVTHRRSASGGSVCLDTDGLN